MSENNEFKLPEGFNRTYVYEAKNYLRSGMNQEDIADLMSEYMIDEIEDTMDEKQLPAESVLEQIVTDLAFQVVNKAIKECLEEEKSWLGTTDCDKLSNAFNELTENGIIAKENFTCCNSCGSYEIAQHAIKGDVGYVFYHQQDTERAVEGEGVYLSYGHIGVAKKSLSEITEQIVQTIEKHGLKVEWNGSVNTRMLVNLDWKKRITVE